MKTTSIGIENLCVSCNAFCRYCLLSSSGKTIGVDYERGKKFAKRIFDEAKKSCSDLQVFYYIGYCMDDACLVDYIKFCQETASPSAAFLQLNGLRMRDEAETKSFIAMIIDVGIKEIDLTFYGTREYHDRFAGRRGDFDYLLRILNSARGQGLKVRISIPVHKENCGQADALLRLLGTDENVSFFLPHSKGRGKNLNSLRLTTDDRDRLTPVLTSQLEKYRSEGEWIQQIAKETVESRSLILSLKPENIDLLESMTLEEIIEHLEDLDDRYYAAIPSVQELATRYGDPFGKRLYRRSRDLYLEWQQKYLNDYKPDLWDMNDETHHFSVRY